MCELTNEGRRGIWEGEGLKETGAYERTDVVSGIKTFVFMSVDRFCPSNSITTEKDGVLKPYRCS